MDSFYKSCRDACIFFPRRQFYAGVQVNWKNSLNATCTTSTPFHSDILTLAVGSTTFSFFQFTVDAQLERWYVLSFLSSGSSAAMFRTSQSILADPEDVRFFCVCKNVRCVLCDVSMHSMEQGWTRTVLSVQHFAVRYLDRIRQTPTGALLGMKRCAK